MAVQLGVPDPSLFPPSHSLHQKRRGENHPFGLLLPRPHAYYMIREPDPRPEAAAVLDWWNHHGRRQAI